MVIALDMDGTIADLYGVEGWLDALRAEDARPYLEAAPLVDVGALNRAIDALHGAGHTVHVISWNCGGNPSGEYRRAVGTAKHEWLAHVGVRGLDSVRVVPHGTPKQDVVEGAGVLFDDDGRNRAAWEASGKGRAYDATRLVARLTAIASASNRF